MCVCVCVCVHTAFSVVCFVSFSTQKDYEGIQGHCSEVFIHSLYGESEQRETSDLTQCIRGSKSYSMFIKEDI